jgi:hypothetical protein
MAGFIDRIGWDGYIDKGVKWKGRASYGAEVKDWGIYGYRILW